MQDKGPLLLRLSYPSVFKQIVFLFLFNASPPRLFPLPSRYGPLNPSCVLILLSDPRKRIPRRHARIRQETQLTRTAATAATATAKSEISTHGSRCCILWFSGFKKHQRKQIATGRQALAIHILLFVVLLSSFRLF